MADCPYLNFCAYEYQYFAGVRIDAEECWINEYIPWYSTGSWVNNQTPGTRATIYYLTTAPWKVRGAYSEQSTGMNWQNVSYVDPC